MMTANRFANAVSIAFVPPAVSTVVFSLLTLAYQRGSAFSMFMVWLVAVLFSGVLQLSYVLYLKREKQVSAYDVPEQLQRTKPYIISVALSLIGFFLLLFLHASIHIWALMWCYAINTLILSGINRFWKISAHMMGLTGPAVMLYPLFGNYLFVLVPFVALLGWARMELKAHTLPQVIAGAVAGIVLTVLQLYLIFSFGL